MHRPTTLDQYTATQSESPIFLSYREATATNTPGQWAISGRQALRDGFPSPWFLQSDLQIPSSVRFCLRSQYEIQQRRCLSVKK